MKKLMLAALVAANLVGCASVQMTDPQQEAAVKTFSAPANKAGLYVYRNETMGGAVKMDVTVDGQKIGQTAARTFLYKEIAPGKHVVGSSAENSDMIEVDAKPGKLYYVWQEVKMGLMSARTKLHLVDDAAGKAGVQETRLAETK